MSTVRRGRPAEVDTTTAAPAQVDTATAAPARHGRLRDAAAKRGVPLATILVSVAVVALTYLAGKLAYRIRELPGWLATTTRRKKRPHRARGPARSRTSTRRG